MLGLTQTRDSIYAAAQPLQAKIFTRQFFLFPPKVFNLDWRGIRKNRYFFIFR